MVHGTGSHPLFEDMQSDQGKGLESIAEDSDPTELASTLASKAGLSVGTFAVPDVAVQGSPVIGFDNGYTFTIDAAPGARLSLASMFVQSNDLFYAPGGEGIALWDEEGGEPISKDATEYFRLWDAGTEVNQEPGEGDQQAPRQSAANTGDDENGAVRLVNDGFTYPSVADVIEVTIQPTSTSREDEIAPEQPDRIALHQNYPNPFNPETMISYLLDASGAVRLQVIDLLGREIATLVDARQAPGAYSVRWDGRTHRGSEVPSGVYLYRLITEEQTITRTMVLIR